ncbi:hypothetical protein [Streptomyces sp. NPDC057301]|uniref:hypothetical protein n=1 Tax=Streptomyces sp. NPDC057301 TaxID=3346093 RepID=UPI0036348AE0
MTLPRLGAIRVHEPTVNLLARVQTGTARVLSATVRHERGRYQTCGQLHCGKQLGLGERLRHTAPVELALQLRRPV